MMIIEIWAFVATVALIAIAIMHFSNPYPLIQIPDRGHRLYSVPQRFHATMVTLFERMGLRPFGTFTMGVRQTLFYDGFTVIASGAGIRTPSISLPTENPKQTAETAKMFLAQHGIESSIWTPPEADLAEILVVLHLPEEFNWSIAFRLPGRRMPAPRWE